MKKQYSIIKAGIDKAQKIAIDLIKKGIDQKDVRVAFFELFQDYYITFYRVHSYMDSRVFKKDSKKIYSKIQGIDNVKDIINFTSHLNYYLVIVTWSTFELCISQICKMILDKESKENLLLANFNRIIKIIKNVLSTDLKDKLLKNQKLVHLEHVTINLKTDKLYKVAQYKDFEKDKKFLQFYGKLRNSIHSNFVYYGKEFNFKFKETTFTFEPEKPIKQEPIDWENDLTFFYISVELMEIYYRLISNFDHKGLIFDPSYADTI